MDYVEIDKKLLRPSEVPYLMGRSTKAKQELLWTPKIHFNNLVERMVQHDIQNHS